MKANDKETEEIEVNEEDAPDPPTNYVNKTDNSDDEKNDYEVSPDTPTNIVNNEKTVNYEDKIMKNILRRKQIMKT